MIRPEYVIYELNAIERGVDSNCSIDVRARLIVIFLFLISLLSLPVLDIKSPLLLMIFPIVECATSSFTYGKIIKRSLIVLPFISLIGITNPIFDKRVFVRVLNIDVTAGWISFVSIILRGMLSTQVVLIIVYRLGFYKICHALQHIGIPYIFTNQLMFAYHYAYIMVEESIWMQRARLARGYGRKNYSFAMWGAIVGQLILRTMDRASTIHKAMLARGFSGHIAMKSVMKWGINDYIYLGCWSCVFVVVRFTDILSMLF